MKKTNDFLIPILLCVLAVAVLIISSLTSTNKNNIDNKPKIVTNYVDFYTVNSCLYRAVTYIYSENIDSLMLVLNDTYKKNNRINSQNVLSFFPKVEKASTFVSKKMYYNEISLTEKKFYVYGHIDEENFDGNTNSKDAYFVVYLNTDKNIFAVEPYDGEIFIGGEQNE